jgi:hypothetical protein
MSANSGPNFVQDLYLRLDSCINRVPLFGWRTEDGAPSCAEAPPGRCSAAVHETRCSGPGRRNAGFWTAPADDLYLPIDRAESRPDVASEEND